MKKLVAVLLFTFAFVCSFAQSCDSIVVNLKKGTINKLKPTATQEEVKAALPCSTGDTEDGSEFNCGGGVFFLDNDFFFYTGKNYIEIREKFNGNLSTPILGLKKVAAIAKLKMGKAVRTIKQKGGVREDVFFKTTYGCVRLQIENGKVKNIALHAAKAKDVVLCL